MVLSQVAADCPATSPAEIERVRRYLAAEAGPSFAFGCGEQRAFSKAEVQPEPFPAIRARRLDEPPKRRLDDVWCHE